MPVFPVKGHAETTGFMHLNHRTLWTWPIWEPEVEIDVVRSLLAHGELQEEHPDRVRLAAMGVLEVFRCQRVTVGKFRNFTPAWTP